MRNDGRLMPVWKIIATVTVCWFLSSGVASGQGDAAGRHEQFIASLKRIAADITSRALDDVASLDEWKKTRTVQYKHFMYTMGLDPMPERTPLRARITGKLKRCGYDIEKIVFQSSPGLYVTGNLYLPHVPNGESPKSTGPLPAVLYVCGHSPHPLGAKWSYQDRAIWFAEHGYVCFIIDTLEFGEVAGIHHGIHDLNRWDWLSRGYTPAGVEVWNAIRAIDYLETRAEVDKARIGITGISGGGAISWYAAAADERIAVSVPVCGTFTFGSQAKHWRAYGQCDCIYYHNTFETDLSVVAALIAPRPLLFCSGHRDADFPPDGHNEVLRRAKRIYDMYCEPKSSDRIKGVDEAVGHTDSRLFRREARQWLNLWLRNDRSPVSNETERGQKPSTAEELACLEKLPRDAINYRIDEVFPPSARPVSYNTLEEWCKRKAELLAELRSKTFRWFATNQIAFDTRVSRNTGGWASRYAEYKDVTIQTEPGVRIRIQLLRARKRTKDTPLLIYAKRRGDSIYFLDLDELLAILGRCDVAIVNPRLTEVSVTAKELSEIERTASWIGRTVASMQVWDILRTVEWLAVEEKLRPTSLSVYGKGEMGIVGLYAALFDDRISQVIVRDPPATHRRGPALLNVLRITDTPEAAAALAPRALVFIDDQVPRAFQWTRSVYDLHEQPTAISSAGSVPEALEVWRY
jgi:cephalosporin-C deacetylase-like acetyl esterase